MAVPSLHTAQTETAACYLVRALQEKENGAKERVTNE